MMAIRGMTPEEYIELETSDQRIVWACVLDGMSVARRFTELIPIGDGADFIGIDGTEDDWHTGVYIGAGSRVITVKTEEST